MGWDRDRSVQEYAWLDLAARIKYDGYRGYLAGARFVESLIDWLQQFDKSDRETLYAFVRRRLVYVGPAELGHVVELFYPETVRRHLVARVAALHGIPPYLVWSRVDSRLTYKRVLRQTLFIGLSDGARMDSFRRANEGRIMNEQVVPTIDIDDDRWASLLKDLRKEYADARFATVFLVDDFTASGLTLIRQKPEDGRWDGKLIRFWNKVKDRIEKQLDPDFDLVVHHYIASDYAASELKSRALAAADVRGEPWLRNVRFTFGTKLPPDLPLSAERDTSLLPLIDRYYNPGIMTPSMRVGGEDGRLGFGGCALPLVLEHNTPNNSIALLWAEQQAAQGYPEMRPLFRRRQRHF